MQAPIDTPPAPKKNNTTLIVVICVICVCGCCCLIVPAILFPVFAQARIAAKRTVALSHLRQLSLATLMYANDNNEVLPPDMSSALTVEPALSRYQPDSTDYSSTNPNGGEILGVPSLSGKKLSDIADRSNTVMFYDSQPWPGNRVIVTFLDGNGLSERPELLSDQLAHSGFHK